MISDETIAKVKDTNRTSRNRRTKIIKQLIKAEYLKATTVNYVPVYTPQNTTLVTNKHHSRAHDIRQHTTAQSSSYITMRVLYN